jgi:hypothetical protein
MPREDRMFAGIAFRQRITLLGQMSSHSWPFMGSRVNLIITMQLLSIWNCCHRIGNREGRSFFHSSTNAIF